jgi:ABC-2 type transport system ATP-binding protein
LATGTVEEIQRGHAPKSEVRVRVLGGGHPLEDWLQGRDDVSDIFVDGELVRFSHDGGREEQADFLKELVLADFRVAEFGSQQKSLEDVFMHVTQGIVQ